MPDKQYHLKRDTTITMIRELHSLLAALIRGISPEGGVLIHVPSLYRPRLTRELQGYRPSIILISFLAILGYSSHYE